MPLSFTPIRFGNIWYGSTWVVEDEEELANALVRVAIGQFAVVEKILRDTNCLTPDMPSDGVQGARNLLTVASSKSAAHRDGWIFQVISWIAAHLQAGAAEQRMLIRPPHMIHAQKGQDGLVIEYSDEDIARIVICEDKATKYPRKQFRDSVLPEFINYETGARDHELIASVTSILTRHETDNTDRIVANILWEDQRAYRVAVTVTAKQTSFADRVRLFKGYKESVPGNVERRRVELMPIVDLRSWMNSLADKALAIMDKHYV